MTEMRNKNEIDELGYFIDLSLFNKKMESKETHFLKGFRFIM